MRTDWRDEVEKSQMDNDKTVDPGAESSVSFNSGTAWPVLDQAMKDLRTALADQKVDHICAAYQSVRHAVHGMKVKEMFDLIQQGAGALSKETILSAHANRSCFMCMAGSTACDQCKGTGRQANGRACASCDGLGRTECTFCRGTGWADMQATPVELRQPVEEKRHTHVMDELKRLQHALAATGMDKLGQAPPKLRSQLVSMAMRLQAQLNDSQARGMLQAHDPAAFDHAISGLGAILDRLRMRDSQPTNGQPSGNPTESE